MTGWKRYLFATLAGAVGVFGWGFLVVSLGGPALLIGVGGSLIAIAAVMWAREK
jgi:inner membrane protein involved in colicin E2 resistance